MVRKRVVILGSTGSIGINTLKVIERYPERFEVAGLTAYSNLSLLERQVAQFKPARIAVNEKGRQYFRRNSLPRGTRVFSVERDLDELVSMKSVDAVVIAMRGSAALKPFLSAVRAGKLVAPANKEALVVAGDLIMREAKKHKATVIPIDSEQSAIFQCLEGRDHQQLKKVWLTASGGALLNVPKTKFRSLTVKQILNHPRWKMGKKITVDSALLMNKGFEVIEAMVLFRLGIEQIEVVIHPEAIIHSMAEFRDGSIIAQLGVADMRLPIQYALSYPERLESGLKGVDFCQLGRLTFHKPDLKKFPALSLAIDAARKGGTLPCVLNAADEVAVEAFLNGKIRFVDIYPTVEKIMRKHRSRKKPPYREIIACDRWAREETMKLIKG